VEIEYLNGRKLFVIPQEARKPNRVTVAFGIRLMGNAVA